MAADEGKMPKKQVLHHIRFLRLVLRDAERALKENNWDEIGTCCDDLDGTSALIREGIAERTNAQPT